MRFSTAVGCIVLSLPLIAWRPPAETPPVDRNSAAIRAVLAQPITKDRLALLTAREKLRMAKDEAAAKAIDLYLAASAVREVFGEASEPKGTVADIVEGRIASPPMNALVRRVLDEALRIEPAADPLRLHGKGDIDVVFALRNMTAGRVLEESFGVKVGRTELNCQNNFKNVPIDANRSVEWVCTTYSGAVTPAQLESDLKTPGWTRMAVSSLKFDDPSLVVNTGSAAWVNNSRTFNAWQKARDELDALGCGARSACLKEAIPTLDTSPGLVFGGMFAGAGLVAGTIFALFTRRRWYWGWILVGIVAACLVAGLVVLVMKNDLAAFAVLIYGPVALGGFLLGLIPPMALIKGRRPE